MVLNTYTVQGRLSETTNEDLVMRLRYSPLRHRIGGGLKYDESHGIKVLTSVKNWHQVRREDDYPERQWYGKD